MFYYKIPLTNGLDYPAGCVLICAYTHEGYEYCKFERVTSVGSGWIEIAESEFNVLCPDFPTPSAPGSTKHITETGEKNGLKYVVYSDGTAECWGTTTQLFNLAHSSSDRGACSLYNELPLEFSAFDSVHITVGQNTYLDGTKVVLLQYINEIAKSKVLDAHFVVTKGDSSTIKHLKLYVTVRGVVS